MRETIGIFLLAGAAASAPACELCAVYSAGSARGESSKGFLVNLSEQYVAYRTTQFNGEDIDDFGGIPADYLDSSITHIVPTYNFSPRFGLSLNVPIVYNSYRQLDVRYSRELPPMSVTNQGSEFGLGDIALIARATLFEKSESDWGVLVNLLGGIKFPTGDSSLIADEVEQSRIFSSFLPPGTPHDPLNHSSASVHQHMISPGSGSYDGIFGLTVNSRYKRWFLNTQFQYYLRTPGEEGFEFGDEIMISGGPGRYLVLHDEWTLSLQLNAAYDSEARARLEGRKTDATGMTAWYLGPNFGFTWGDHFSANAGVDVPLHITSNGFQNVPTYRVHAGVNYRF